MVSSTPRISEPLLRSNVCRTHTGIPLPFPTGQCDLRLRKSTNLLVAYTKFVPEVVHMRAEKL